MSVHRFHQDMSRGAVGSGKQERPNYESPGINWADSFRPKFPFPSASSQESQVKGVGGDRSRSKEEEAEDA